MKAINWKVLCLFTILSIGLFACDKEEPEVITEEPVPIKGDVFFGDSMVIQAFVEFDDSTLIETLKRYTWKTQRPCVYDEKGIRAFSVVFYGVSSYFELHFGANQEFSSKHKSRDYLYDVIKGTWYVKNGLITITSTDGEICELNVVAIDDDFFICDMAYYDYYDFLAKYDKKGVNKETAMLRFLWQNEKVFQK